MAAGYSYVMNTTHMNATDTCGDFKVSNYITVFLVVIGVMSNVLALSILADKYTDRSSAALYMTVYAWFNVATLLLMYGVDAVLCLSRNPHPRVAEQWVCSLLVFLASVIVHSRVWLLLTLCVDRLVCMFFSRLRLSFCTSFTAKCVVLAIMAVLVFTSVHALWWYENTKHGCYLYTDSPILKLWTWASWTIYFFLPCLLLGLTTACLAVLLCASRRPEVYLSRSWLNPQSIRPASVDDLAPAAVIVSLTYLLLSAPQEGIDALSVCLPRLWLEADLVKEIDKFTKAAQTTNVFQHALLGLILVLCPPKSYMRKTDRSVGRGGRDTNYETANNSSFFPIQDTSCE